MDDFAWLAERDRTGEDEYLAQLALLIEGRNVTRDDGSRRLVRLPSRLGRGEVYFVWYGPDEKAIAVDLKVGSSLVFILGKPRWKGGATATIDGQDPPIYFAPSISDETTIRTWLADGGSETIENLRLGLSDCVDVYSTAIQFVGSPETPGKMAARIRALVLMARSLPAAAPGRRAKLPADFAELQPLARRWTISDDQERADSIDRATSRTLRRLVDSVKPRLGEIDRFLDSAGEPLPEAFVDLQTVALAAVEADMELARRAGSSDIRER